MKKGLLSTGLLSLLLIGCGGGGSSGNADVDGGDITTPTNNPPTNILLSNNSILENEPSGTTIGTLSSVDADIGDSAVFSINCLVSGSDDANFIISGTTLQSASIFDYEIQNSYEVCIRVKDGGGDTFDKNFEINVTEVTEMDSAKFDTNTFVPETGLVFDADTFN